MSAYLRLRVLLILIIAVNKVENQYDSQKTGQGGKVFRITLASNGTELCAVDPPTAVFTISELNESSINIIGCAPPKALCARKCMKDQHCISYNWKDDSQLCELFRYPPENCAVISRCCYYQVCLSACSYCLHFLNVRVNIRASSERVHSENSYSVPHWDFPRIFYVKLA